MARTVSTVQKRERPRTKPVVYDRLNRWFDAHIRRWILFVLAVGLVAGLLTFDIKPSTGGDDTAFVLQAMNFVSTGHLPIGFRTPGYPMVLALFVWIFGVKLVLLKATSLVFFLATLVSLFYVFRSRIRPMVLYPLLLLLAINPLILEYSHQTYSELLFTLTLVWTIHFVLLASERESMRFTLLAALLTMASFYVRVAGAAAGGAVVLFFAWQHRWKQLGVFIFACLLLYSPIKIYEWTSGSSAFGQASILLLKNPYNAMQGMETFGGFIERFVNNIINYANYQFPYALGLPMPPEIAMADGRLIPDASAFAGLLVSAVVLAGCIAPVFSRSKPPTALLGIFVLTYIAFVSLALQNLFATPRMLVPVLPYLFIGILEGLHWLGNRRSKTTEEESVSRRAKTFTVLGITGLMLAGISGAGQAVSRNYPVLKANLSGNEFAGFTEDWVNYLRASVWIKERLPEETTRVICRKPELFTLYAGNYYTDGVYMIDQTNPDSVVAKWKRLRMTHLLYDDFQWSSTLRRYVQPVAQKYPQMFELIHQEGKQFPSYVFQLNYAAVDSARNR
jgi:hypothetical protein